MINFALIKLNLSTLILFPNAKINIGLNILFKRPDGYHEIESVFYPIPLYDVLEILPSDELSFQTSGIKIPGDNNLCLDAYHLLKSIFPDLAPVSMFLIKNIPIGAGLGGGSADASFVLLALNQLFDLKLTVEELQELALDLGADCHFFILNQPCLVRGVGEKLTTIDFNLSSYFLELNFSNIHISTKEAYSGVFPSSSLTVLSEEIQKNVFEWNMKNDFEASIFPNYPSLVEIKNKMLNSGAEYCSMTGSGSSIYALHKQKPAKSLENSIFLEL